MRMLLTIAFLLAAVGAHAQTSPTNAPSGSGTPIGPRPVPAVPPPNNQTATGTSPPGHIAPPLETAPRGDTNTSVPEK